MSKETEAKPGKMGAYGALPIPRLSPELLGLVRTGRVYSLAVILENGMPVPSVQAQFFLSPHIRHGDLDILRPASGASEVMSLSAHAGTHVDALCHIGEWRDGRVMLYGNVFADEVAGPDGQGANGAEHFPPIALRGVLLDMARFKGLEVLSDSYEIGGEELQECARKQGVELSSGCCVLLRTGYMKYWRDDKRRFLDTPPGPNVDGAAYLAKRGAILVGSDTATFEAMPHLDHPVHRYMQTERGISFIENMWLEDLAADRAWESLLILAPLRIKGATASPVHPIAIT
jgi:kynurenine formamidase